MSKETEKIFRELEKYLKDKEIKTEEEYEKEVKRFIDLCNNKALQKKGKDAWDYLDMAYEAENDQDALKHAKKALQLDKNCLDAEVMITELTTEDDEVLKNKYEGLIKKTEKHLTETGFLSDENIGSFWSIVETRPYMRLRYAYANLLLDQGKFRKAAKECEDLLLLSENDNMGVRYLLMSLYVFFEDEVNVMRLYKKYRKESSTHMLLPIVALYYKMDNYEKAELYLKKLGEVNKELEEVFCNAENFDHLMELDDIPDSGMFRYGSAEEIMAAIADSAFLYTATTGLFPWVAKRVRKGK